MGIHASVQRFYILVGLVVVATNLSGCQQKNARPSVQIKGVVTFDGVPLEEGSIHFSSSKTGESAYSNLAAGGQYQITFVEADLGEKYAVSIGRTVLDESEVQAADLKPQPPLKAKIPKRYLDRQSSGLSAVVKDAGKNEIDFALLSK